MTPPDSPQEPFVDLNQHNQQLSSRSKHDKDYYSISITITIIIDNLPPLNPNNSPINLTAHGLPSGQYYASYGHNPHFIPQGHGQPSPRDPHNPQHTAQYFQQPPHSPQYHYPPSPQHIPQYIQYSPRGHDPHNSQIYYYVPQDSQQLSSAQDLEESILASSYSRPQSRHYNLPNSMKPSSKNSQNKRVGGKSGTGELSPAATTKRDITIQKQPQYQQFVIAASGRPIPHSISPNINDSTRLNQKQNPTRDNNNTLTPRTVSPNASTDNQQRMNHYQQKIIPGNDRLISSSDIDNTNQVQNMLIPKSISPNISGRNSSLSPKQADQYQHNNLIPNSISPNIVISDKAILNSDGSAHVPVTASLVAEGNPQTEEQASIQILSNIVSNEISPIVNHPGQVSSINYVPSSEGMPIDGYGTESNGTIKQASSQILLTSNSNEDEAMPPTDNDHDETAQRQAISNTTNIWEATTAQDQGSFPTITTIDNMPVILIPSNTMGASNERIPLPPQALLSSTVPSTASLNDNQQQQQVSPRTLLKSVNTGEIKPNTELMRMHSVRVRPVPQAKKGVTPEKQSINDDDDDEFVDAVSEVAKPLINTDTDSNASQKSKKRKSQKEAKGSDKGEKHSRRPSLRFRSPVRTSIKDTKAVEFMTRK